MNMSLHINVLKEQLKKAIKEKRQTGDYGMYAVNDKVVGKFGKSLSNRHSRYTNFSQVQQETIPCSYNEFIWGRFAKENGVSVPEMYGIVVIDGQSYILMQRLYKGFCVESEKLYKKEMEKVLDLGICPCSPKDTDFDGNYMFDARTQKLYLFDFEYWQKATKSNEYLVRKVREYLETL